MIHLNTLTYQVHVHQKDNLQAQKKKISIDLQKKPVSCLDTGRFCKAWPALYTIIIHDLFFWENGGLFIWKNGVWFPFCCLNQSLQCVCTRMCLYKCVLSVVIESFVPPFCRVLAFVLIFCNEENLNKLLYVSNSHCVVSKHNSPLTWNWKIYFWNLYS